MFSEDELNAFYEGKKQGYEKKEYSNPHMDFISGLGGAAAITESKLHDQFKRGYEWGKEQRYEEDSNK